MCNGFQTFTIYVILVVLFYSSVLQDCSITNICILELYKNPRHQHTLCSTRQRNSFDSATRSFTFSHLHQLRVQHRKGRLQWLCNLGRIWRDHEPREMKFFTAVKVIMIFLVLTLCRIIDRYQRYSEICLHFQPWKWKQYVSPKRCHLHGAKTQKNAIIKQGSISTITKFLNRENKTDSYREV